MQGSILRFYVPEGEREDGQLLWEWILRRASDLGIRGGSAFKAMAGFGQRHEMHEARFFELAGDLAVEVQFVVTTAEQEKLLELLASLKTPLFYASTPATFGVLGVRDTKPG